MSSDLERDEVEMEEQVAEPKRGRGRPKKIGAKSKAEEKSSDEPLAKRGRGRPAGGAAKAKAGKANKAKKTEEDADAGDEEAGKAPPKRRGRKPALKAKEPSPEPESEVDSVLSHAESEEEASVPVPPAKTKVGKGGKKAARNGHTNGGENDEDADEDDSEKSEGASSDSKIKIVVEHCKSCQTYRKKAEDIITALKEKWSNIDVEYNPKPRKGSFEINLVNHGSDVKLWTGLELGPPRKLKFPEAEKVVEAMEKAYVPESA